MAFRGSMGECQYFTMRLQHFVHPATSAVSLVCAVNIFERLLLGEEAGHAMTQFL